MRILIISDSHGHTDEFDFVIDNEEPFDMILHCGDGCNEVDYFENRGKCSLRYVRGNCDFFCMARDVIVFSIEGHKCLMQHNLEERRRSIPELVRYARDNGVDVLLGGHTHIQRVDESDGVWIVNPGSISKPRDKDRGSYIVLTTDGQGGLNFETKRI